MRGLKDHFNDANFKGNAFAPNDAKERVVFSCGYPAMIQKAALPALKYWGYEEEKECLGVWVGAY
ncbi:hypothetical protein WAI453_007860 [Rhynchosporium graminicola]